METNPFTKSSMTHLATKSKRSPTNNCVEKYGVPSLINWVIAKLIWDSINGYAYMGKMKFQIPKITKLEISKDEDAQIILLISLFAPKNPKIKAINIGIKYKSIWKIPDRAKRLLMLSILLCKACPWGWEVKIRL